MALIPLTVRTNSLDGWLPKSLGARLSGNSDGGSLRVGVLLVVILLLNAIDLHYTLLAHRAGMLQELNPIAANLLHLDLEPSLICYKALTILIGSSLLWRLRRSPWTPAACWLLVLVYAGITVMWYFWTQDYLEVLHARAVLSQTYVMPAGM